MNDVVARARPLAIEALRRCCGPRGLRASGRRLGHHQVWARDSMIALLGARFAGDAEVDEALRRSIETLRGAMSSRGEIPNNVDAETGRPNFRAYADAGLWWVIGSSLVAPDVETTRRVLAWGECQDVDQSGLLSMQEGADWQDLFCTRGKGLYLNCVYVLALCRAARIDSENRDGYLRRADDARSKINDFFWYHGDGNMLRHVAHTFSTESKQEQDSLGRKRWLPHKQSLVDERYYLPYLGFRAVGEWFDSLGNLLAILSGAAREKQTQIVLDLIERHELTEFPLRSLTPVICPGDPDWRDYYGMLNLPHCYHNGGVWPFIGGFYVAALVHAGRSEDAAKALQRLAELNLAGEFNEWHHGETGKPMGVADQAWSAGMFLFAYESVRLGRVPLE